VAILLALSASLCWGLADFLAGTSSRRLPVLSVLATSQLAGLVFVALVLAARHEPPHSSRIVLAAVLGGLASSTALACFYRALALGRMSVVTPIASTNPVIPLTVGVFLGNRLRLSQWIGIPLAIIGVIAVARGRLHAGSEGLDAGVWFAILSAVLFGCHGLALYAASGDPIWAAGIQLTTATLGLAAFVLLTDHTFGIVRTDLPALSLIGIFEVGATLLLLFAYGHGPLGLVAVMGALSPVVTVFLAQVILRERLTPLQAAGATLTLTGVVLVSAALG
jgi:drug/metabolite transporter (DMT)-like permease